MRSGIFKKVFASCPDRVDRKRVRKGERAIEEKIRQWLAKSEV